MRTMCIVVSFLFIIVSCDFYTLCYVTNESNETIKVKTKPPLESLYDNEYRSQSFKYRVELKDSFAFYEVPPYHEICIASVLGGIPREDEIMIYFIEIFSEDTLIFQTKKEIFTAFEKTDTRIYKIIVKN